MSLPLPAESSAIGTAVFTPLQTARILPPVDDDVMMSVPDKVHGRGLLDLGSRCTQSGLVWIFRMVSPVGNWWKRPVPPSTRIGSHRREVGLVALLPTPLPRRAGWSRTTDLPFIGRTLLPLSYCSLYGLRFPCFASSIDFHNRRTSSGSLLISSVVI